MKGRELLVRAEAFVRNVFDDSRWEGFSFHSINHTIRVCKKADEFGKGSALNEDDYLALMLAAMFHDTGYAFNYSDHETESVRIFQDFIGTEEYDGSEMVEQLILATGTSAEPLNSELEKIMHDIDRIGVGLPDFFEIGNMLRDEWAAKENRKFSDGEWAQLQLDYLDQTGFLTEYGREKFGKQRLRNIEVAKSALVKS